MPSIDILSQFNPMILFSGGLIGLLTIVFLLAVPILERKIPIIKALSLSRRLKSIPFLGEYYAQARRLNSQVTEQINQIQEVQEDKERLSRAWNKTFPQDRNGGNSGPDAGNSQNGRKSTDRGAANRNEFDQQDVSSGSTGGWSPNRSGMVQLGQRSGPPSRGFLPSAKDGVVVPASGNQTVVSWALSEKKLLEENPGSAPSAYNPPIGRIPVPPEFDVDIDTSSKMQERELLGRRIERYQVDAILHEGDLSHVYQAYDMKIGRLIALKLMRFPNYLSREQQVSVFEDMRTLSSADHANLTHLYDFGEDDGRLFVVSQLVRGVPIDTHLQHMMHQGVPVELGPILETVAQVVGALEEVHDLQLVHGLIKPGHLLLEPLNAANDAFHVKLLDVGLINLYPTIEHVPPSFWPYVSPEYCQTGRIDPRSDIYSMGALLYHLLTGQPPLSPMSPEHATQLHTTAEPIKPTELSQTMPAVVEEIILKALAKNPADRFQSAQAFKAALVEAANPITGRYEDRKFLKEGDRLITITAPGQGRKTVVLNQSNAYAGSGAENDIVLTGVDISDRHLRIEFEGSNFMVTNISTQSNTYLQGVRMLPDLPEIWDAGNPLQIGAYTFNWEEIVEDISIAPPLFDTLLDKLVGISVQPALLTLSPGEFGDIQINLVNQASHVDEFEIQIEQLPETWVQLSSNHLSLLPGDQSPAVLNISVPKGTDVIPKDYPFVIRVVPAAYPEHAVVTSAALRVLPVVQVESDLSPKHLRNRGHLTLNMMSTGNAVTTLSINITEEDNPLFFDYNRKPIKVRPGETKVLDIGVSPFRRSIFGYTRGVPFTVEVSDEKRETVFDTHQVQASITPYLPAWALSVIGFLVIVGFLIYPSIQPYFATEEVVPLAGIAMDVGGPASEESELLITVDEGFLNSGLDSTTNLPLSCADIKAQDSEVEPVDGEFELYVSRDEAFPISIYCHNMAGAPLEYLTVDTAGTGSNFSTVVQDEGVSVTTFERIRIDMTTLRIDRTDLTFAVQNDAESASKDFIRDYASALGCQSDPNSDEMAVARIDLSETPLGIHSSNQFVVDGIEASGTTTISSDTRIATLEVTGQCGWIWPGADLQLAYLVVNRGSLAEDLQVEN